MSNGSGKLYAILLILCAAGYIWLFISTTTNIIEEKKVEACLIKHITNIPCPSCGSTRSVVSITKGDFYKALMINPLGYVVATTMILAPIWIAVDLTTKKKTFFEFYNKAETYLKKPILAVPLIILIIANWIWNIIKGL